MLVIYLLISNVFDMGTNKSEPPSPILKNPKFEEWAGGDQIWALFWRIREHQNTNSQQLGPSGLWFLFGIDMKREFKDIFTWNKIFHSYPNEYKPANFRDGPKNTGFWGETNVTDVLWSGGWMKILTPDGFPFKMPH